MTDGFAGKIEVDIRDSVPDWTPFLAPKAAPGSPTVLFVVGGSIEKVVIDVSGERYVDHEAQVRGWFLLD